MLKVFQASSPAELLGNPAGIWTFLGGLKYIGMDAVNLFRVTSENIFIEPELLTLYETNYFRR